MKCRNCGAVVNDDTRLCPECGTRMDYYKKVCIECGALLDEDSIFCEECGAKVASPQVKICKKCGAVLMPNAVFCHECGAKNSIRDERKERESFDPNKAGRTGSEKHNKTKKKKKKNKPSYFFFFTLSLVILFAVIAVLFMASSSSEDATNPTITVIDVNKMPYLKAVEALTEAGFSYITANLPNNADPTEYIVTGQSAPAGKRLHANEQIKLDCEKKCKIYIDIKVLTNVLFGTYDVSVFFDNEEKGRVPNGEEFATLLDTYTGTHTILFRKSGSTSPNVSKVLDISGDMTYSCTLSRDTSTIEIRNEQITDNIHNAELVVGNVTGLNLSEAEKRLKEIGFSNLRGEPYGDIWKKDNWIVISQSVPEGTIAGKTERITLNCISLDEYYSNNSVGKNLNEVLEFAAHNNIKIIFENENRTKITDKVDSMDQKTKNDWIVKSAQQYSGSENTALMIIVFTGEPTPTPIPTPPPSPTPAPTPAPTPTPRKYDIDKDLIVTECRRDNDAKTMYHVTFSDVDNHGNILNSFTFDSRINPREMGKNFNAIGALPLWFYKGATVHVKADLDHGGKLTNCTVTEATGKNKATENSVVSEIPIMTGRYLDDIVKAAKEKGVSIRVDDFKIDHGVRIRSLSSKNGGLSLDIIYMPSTKEVLNSSIITYSVLSSQKEQRSFITEMAKYLCPPPSKDAVSQWVKKSIGKEAETTIDGFVYSLSLGPTGNLIYDAGVKNWEEWELSFEK